MPFCEKFFSHRPQALVRTGLLRSCFRAVAWRASLVPDEGCRAASLGEPLVLSASRVPRGVVLLERDTYGELHTLEHQATIALARCLRCGTRPRILPYDVLPYKQYSLTVITALVSTYNTWCLSLRRVVWDLLGERTPAHTTLHGWTEGLGAHALGLPGAQLGGSPFSRFLVEPDLVAARAALIVSCASSPRSAESHRMPTRFPRGSGWQARAAVTSSIWSSESVKW